jgi:acyl-CoA thioester hydrolase
MSKRTGLMTSKEFTPRFSEVDSMRIVWHGSYPLYFEDAREEFGKKYGFGYLDIFGQGYFTPLVDLSLHYKRPMIYGNKYRVDIHYRPTEAAKIIFDYEIYDLESGELCTTGSSIQIFMDKNYQLVWISPEFYENWKKQWGVAE